VYENLTILGAFIFLYSIVSGGLARTPVNGAIVFTAFGLLFGPLGFGLIHLNVDAEGLRTLAELTLALVLFTDAASSNLNVLKHSRRIPQRLLLIGLPLTILLGFGLGILLFKNLTLVEVALLATMLAPTDAALGKAVVTDESVPPPIREGLNVESGLNDGICVPILFAFLALASESGAGESGTLFAVKLVIQQIGIGAGVGLGISVLGAWLIHQSARRGWITETWQQIPVVGLAFICFALAQFLGGSGFIACFAGGLAFGGVSRRHKHKLLLAAEGLGDSLALITWVVFGAGVIGQSIQYFRWEVVLYAGLCLTLIRIIPVFLALFGMGMRTDEKLFVGWFGPRGLASIVFAVIVLDEHLAGGGTITITVVCTIMLSILAHGLTAYPLVAVLKSRLSESRFSRSSDTL